MRFYDRSTVFKKRQKYPNPRFSPFRSQIFPVSIPDRRALMNVYSPVVRVLKTTLSKMAIFQGKVSKNFSALPDSLAHCTFFLNPRFLQFLHHFLDEACSFRFDIFPFPDEVSKFQFDFRLHFLEACLFSFHFLHFF